jgi:hypothetical protein
MDPTLTGILFAALVYGIVMLVRRPSSHVRPVQA